MTKYRPHRGMLADAMREVHEVKSFGELIRVMRAEVESWYPPDKLPTEANTKVEYYGRDDRIGWDTYIVTVDGQAWGFTDGPVP
jgi:N6-adenosine-specific RNA methylase IME4